jgi:2-polyprenyl-3-methyl-5-hydroxy-6-metoxy-1,4-benzoquinol methylase
MSNRLEHPVLFKDEKTGWPADKPNELAFTLTRYTFALTVASEIPEEKRGSYLDFGCGTGLGTELVATAFRESYGVDKRPECVDYAYRLHNRSGVIYTQSFDHIPSATTFDFITLLEVLEHLPPEGGEALIRELSNALTDWGVLFLTTPAKGHAEKEVPNPYHLHEYTPKELGELLKRHFADVELKPFLSNEFAQAICKGPKR